MDVNIVADFISKVGFPIAVSCALLWYFIVGRKPKCPKCDKDDDNEV